MKKVEMETQGYKFEEDELAGVHPLIQGAFEQPQSKPSTSWTVLKIALEVLSGKLLLYFAASGSLGLYVYASIYPDSWRFICASMFTISVFLPMLWRDYKS